MDRLKASTPALSACRLTPAMLPAAFLTKLHVRDAVMDNFTSASLKSILGGLGFALAGANLDGSDGRAVVSTTVRSSLTTGRCSTGPSRHHNHLRPSFC